MVSSVGLGIGVGIPNFNKKAKARNLYVLHKFVKVNGDQNDFTKTPIRRRWAKLSGIAESDGMLQVILPDGYKARIESRVKRPRVVIDPLNPTPANSVGDTLDVVVITGSHNPCDLNPFGCGCPMQSPSCLDDQGNSANNNSQDPCAINPANCGEHQGGQGNDPNSEITDLNPCEVAFSVLNPISATVASYIKRDVEVMFQSDPTLLGLGGNIDNTPANALKHVIWNIKMVCELGLEMAETIAYNHEICYGVRMNPLSSYRMDMLNNKLGQDIGVALKNSGNCNDDDVIKQAAYNNYDDLAFFQPN